MVELNILFNGSTGVAVDAETARKTNLICGRYEQHCWYALKW
jgi:hypothetical protein